VGLRFNPPPGWPPVREGFSPRPGWRPPESWPPAPPGWQLWVSDDEPSAAGWSPRSSPASQLTARTQQGYNPGGSYGTDSQYPDDNTRRTRSHYPDDNTYRTRSHYPDDNTYGTDTRLGAGAPYAGPGRTGAPYRPGSTGYQYPGPDNTGRPFEPYPPGVDYAGSGSGYAGYGTPDSTKTNGFAIASLVTGILGGAVIGAILGFVALSKIKRTGQRGRRMAVYGILLSGIWILVVLAATLGNLGRATRAPNGQINKSGTLSVFSLRVGDCFNLPSGLNGVQAVTAIPCTQSHDAQVYAAFNLGGSTYPANVKQLANQGCAARKASVNTSAIPSSTSGYSFYPDQNAWSSGSRNVQCVIASPGTNVKTSLLNT
jgi:hypothetical protein